MRREERWWEGGKRNERGEGFEEKEGREGVVIVVGDESIGFLRIEDAIVEGRVVNLKGDDEREEEEGLINVAAVT